MLLCENVVFDRLVRSRYPYHIPHFGVKNEYESFSFLRKKEKESIY